mmetsp:Transcript_83589/g.236643  ORF Transcript_83589/g.236643 Transcript_83589/m.236643 type:complete len:318 (-) Transcript_83589:2621-3574(-)
MRLAACCSRSSSDLSLAPAWRSFSSRIFGFAGSSAAPLMSFSVAPAAIVTASSSFSKSSVALKVSTREAVLTGLVSWSSSLPRITWSARRICWTCGIHLEATLQLLSYWASLSSRVLATSEAGSGSGSAFARPCSCLRMLPKPVASARGASRSSTVIASPPPPEWNSDSGCPSAPNARPADSAGGCPAESLSLPTASISRLPASSASASPSSPLAKSWSASSTGSAGLGGRFCRRRLAPTARLSLGAVSSGCSTRSASSSPGFSSSSSASAVSGMAWPPPSRICGREIGVDGSQSESSSSSSGDCRALRTARQKSTA